MENILEYKGYMGRVILASDGQEFHGVVLNLRDSIFFHGRSLDELRTSLGRAVDGYLQQCAEQGCQPERPYTGKLMVRLPPDLHRRASVCAHKAGLSLNQWVIQAVNDLVVRQECQE